MTIHSVYSHALESTKGWQAEGGEVARWAYIYTYIDKWLAIARSGGDGPDSDARTDSPEDTEADMGSNPHVTCMTVVVENSKFVFDSNICNGVLNRSPRWSTLHGASGNLSFKGGEVRYRELNSNLLAPNNQTHDIQDMIMIT